MRVDTPGSADLTGVAVDMTKPSVTEQAGDPRASSVRRGPTGRRDPRGSPPRWLPLPSSDGTVMLKRFACPRNQDLLDWTWSDGGCSPPRTGRCRTAKGWRFSGPPPLTNLRTIKSFSISDLPN